MDTIPLPPATKEPLMVRIKHKLEDTLWLDVVVWHLKYANVTLFFASLLSGMLIKSLPILLVVLGLLIVGHVVLWWMAENNANFLREPIVLSPKEQDRRKEEAKSKKIVDKGD